jgi:hypothetical protein
MTILHIARDQHRAGVLHAAAVGDDVSVCGYPLGEVLDQEWEAAPHSRACQRCQHAVAVLRQISAV